MNFTDASSDKPVGTKTPDRKSNEMGENAAGESQLDKTAMNAAQKGQDRQLRNEQTNSSNTTFSK